MNKHTVYTTVVHYVLCSFSCRQLLFHDTFLAEILNSPFVLRCQIHQSFLLSLELTSCGLDTLLESSFPNDKIQTRRSIPINNKDISSQVSTAKSIINLLLEYSCYYNNMYIMCVEAMSRHSAQHTRGTCSCITSPDSLLRISPTTIHTHISLSNPNSSRNTD